MASNARCAQQWQRRPGRSAVPGRWLALGQGSDEGAHQGVAWHPRCPRPVPCARHGVAAIRIGPTRPSAPATGAPTRATLAQRPGQVLGWLAAGQQGGGFRAFTTSRSTSGSRLTASGRKGAALSTVRAPARARSQRQRAMLAGGSSCWATIQRTPASARLRPGPPAWRRWSRRR